MGAIVQNKRDFRLGRRTCESGFTLLELVIVGAILSTAAAIAVPAYLNWVPRYQLTQTHSALAANVNLAKVMARTRNTTVTVGLVNLAGTWHMQFGGGLVAPEALPSTITATAGAVGFDPRGLSTAVANQTLVVSNNQGMSYAVTVTPAGKVLACKKTPCP